MWLRHKLLSIAGIIINSGMASCFDGIFVFFSNAPLALMFSSVFSCCVCATSGETPEPVYNNRFKQIHTRWLCNKVPFLNCQQSLLNNRNQRQQHTKKQKLLLSKPKLLGFWALGGHIANKKTPFPHLTIDPPFNWKRLQEEEEFIRPNKLCTI